MFPLHRFLYSNVLFVVKAALFVRFNYSTCWYTYRQSSCDVTSILIHSLVLRSVRAIPIKVPPILLGAMSVFRNSSECNLRDTAPLRYVSDHALIKTFSLPLQLSNTTSQTEASPSRLLPPRRTCDIVFNNCRPFP